MNGIFAIKSIEKASRLIPLLLVSVLVAGCIAMPPELPETETATADDSFNRLVSRDVVAVLVQIDRLAPETTILGISNTALQEKFAQALRNELQAAGYAIRSAGSGPGTIQVSYEASAAGTGELADPASHPQTITVFAGDIAVRRTYVADADGRINPVGTMQVKGVDARRLTLDNDIFTPPADKAEPVNPPTVPVEPTPPNTLIVQNPVEKSDTVADVPQVPEKPLTQVENQSAAVNSASLPSSSDKDNNSPLLDLVAPSVSAASAQTLNSIALQSTQPTANVMELTESNFESLFSEMGIVSEKVLTFPNDSTRMGDVNKARVRELLRRFDPASDVLSVIGCSLGPTNHTGGQEGLARGRATRVRDELLYAGVPEENILEEGCWAEEAFDLRMPRRGVVITLKRRVS